MRRSHAGLRETAWVRTSAGATPLPSAPTAARARPGGRHGAVTVKAVDGNDYQTLLVASTAAVAVGTSLYLGLQVSVSSLAASSAIPASAFSSARGTAMMWE
jgi:hypothetical protein